MQTSNKTNAVIAYTAVALFAFSLLGIIILYNNNQKMEQALNESRLNAESLLSEKLSVEKQIVQFKNDIQALNGKNKELDKILAETSGKLAQKEAEYKAAIHGKSVKIKSLEDQLAQIQKIKSELENEKEALAQNIQQLKNSSKDLNNLIASLQEKNKKHEENLALQRAIADNFIVESLKGKKEKLTVNSRKTNKVMVGFDVPQKIVEDINFKITTPEGKVFASNDKNATGISLRVIENDELLVASLSPMTGNFEISKRIEMTYKPQEKLKKGIYKIQVYNGNTYLGSCQMRLK